MSELIGYWLINEAIIVGVIWLIGGIEMDTKTVIGTIVGMSIFITILMCGAYLICK